MKFLFGTTVGNKQNLACYLVLAATMFVGPTSSLARPPNVVLIVADDLGYGDLGCYGSRQNRTPHIDSLAEQGVRFTDFHSSGPMCTPTRVSILTGKYQQRFGSLFDGPLSGATQRDVGLPHSAVTVAELLKRAGYATACFGKWHLGFEPPWLPTNQGFDTFRGLAAGDGDHHSHIDRYGNHDWWRNEERISETGYTAELLAKHSINFIKRNRQRPFFLYIPHLAIHFPWQGPEDPPHRIPGVDYRADKWGIIPNPANVSPHVKSMVEALDASTGRVLDTLKRLQLLEDTIIIFTSDNGGYLNYGNKFQQISSNGQLRGQKATLYEGGHRVPLLVAWPSRIESKISHVLTHSNDLLPTICSFAQIDQNQVDSDGRNLASLLLRNSPPDDRMLFWRAGEEWAIRDGVWKLVFEQGKLQLFDLEQDVQEKRDLTSEHPRVVARLQNAWKRWNAQMPE